MGTLFLCVAGSIVFGIGFYQDGVEAPRRRAMTLMLLFCSIGFVLLMAGAAQASRWSERMMIVGPYIVCGIFIGEMLQRADARRRSGPILAKLGIIAPRGYVVVAIISGAGGMIALTFGLFEPHPFKVATIVASYLFFAILLAKAAPRWLMTQLGLVGLGRFIHWREIEEYRWTHAGALSLTTSFSHPRPLIISIPSKMRSQVEGVLSEHLPEQRREENPA